MKVSGAIPVCAGSPGADCGPQDAFVATFEEPTLRELNEAVTRWLAEHPAWVPISLSHGFQTEWKHAPMANPQPEPTHSALLLVCRLPGKQRARTSDGHKKIARHREHPRPEAPDAKMATMVCEQDGEALCRAEGPCTVFFEAQNLGLLGRKVMDWMASHPHYRSISLSHAVETRWKRAPMANPQPVSAYTGVLLVHAG
ncbi:hypothetical protein RxyAA322_27900 [Rubrobacter xylanophilus]|uniref:Uncharacterized protein n=1 Tax=Rubrobacter xylanophilus TaxID=49319 RepID=A0A510HLM8_9ACTN|nr:hypothetical protein [Rubrobacter xylanophilus]BBL80936.1 hypothetical protein RxyAA322_27900 [Rubrobacter xylanophilus]